MPIDFETTGTQRVALVSRLVSVVGGMAKRQADQSVVCKPPDRRTIKQSWQGQRDAETDSPLHAPVLLRPTSRARPW